MTIKPKLYPISHGRKITEENVIAMYKYSDKKSMRCQFVERPGTVCPKADDGTSCYYCIAAPINYQVTLKKHNIKKIKGISL